MINVGSRFAHKLSTKEVSVPYIYKPELFTVLR